MVPVEGVGGASFMSFTSHLCSILIGQHLLEAVTSLSKLPSHWPIFLLEMEIDDAFMELLML